MFGSAQFFYVINTNSDHGLSAGYELKKFRTNRLAELLIEAMPDFALKHSELSGISRAKMVAKLKKSAQMMYTTKKYKNRGEIGELLLHLIMRDFFKTTPAISKLYYKDSPNDTVKGFDSVHIKKNGKALDLWIGESKIYKSVKRGISSIKKDINTHFKTSFLRQEFLFISNKIDEKWEYKDALEKLISQNMSLDKIFGRVNLVCMVSYDCAVTSKHSDLDDNFIADLEKSIKNITTSFRNGLGKVPVNVILVLVPLHSKLELLKIMDSKIKSLQVL